MYSLFNGKPDNLRAVIVSSIYSKL